MTGPVSGLPRRSALVLLAGAGAALATPAQAVGAIKHYIIIELKNGADQLSLDRWYITFHSREVRRAFKAWQRNYISFRSYLPPAEAVKAYGVVYGRMTEIQFDTFDDYRETRPNNIYGQSVGSYTPPPGGWTGDRKIFESTTASVPVNPQQLYVSNNTPPKEDPYLRWIIFFRYPKGVTLEQGDAWYRDVHSKEVAKLPGLKRYGRYETISPTPEFPRVAELWFDDYAGWKRAFLDPKLKFTPPPWGGVFPFMETLSMFIGENPDVDFINDKRVIP